MSRFSDSIRSHLLETFSGDTAGTPYWVKNIEAGDDIGFFGPGSASWAVHGGMPTMVAGIRALLMQTLHPGAMTGVHDWSRYKEDPLGRLAGTIQWLITVTFGDTALAEKESGRVSKFHDRVKGTYIDAQGNEQNYSAGDPELLYWVHVVFTDAFLGCQQAWGEAIPGGADQYVNEWAIAGELVGVVRIQPNRDREVGVEAFGVKPDAPALLAVGQGLAAGQHQADDQLVVEGQQIGLTVSAHAATQLGYGLFGAADDLGMQLP